MEKKKPYPYPWRKPEKTPERPLPVSSRTSPASPSSPASRPSPAPRKPGAAPVGSRPAFPRPFAPADPPRTLLPRKTALDPVEDREEEKPDTPFVTYSYSYKSMTFGEGKTHVQARRETFANGRLESEDFEGTVEDPDMFQSAAERLRDRFLRRSTDLFSPLSRFLPEDMPDLLEDLTEDPTDSDDDIPGGGHRKPR